ncbi:Protein CBG21386 [Caenorhabditis briggsae]|uniref:Protein CBG21386 n=1 Tax=Caenorhabditis briggsae TaxID=6238 RepID=A8XZZ0_CAEBR|nr:Protein CBG21386 [Caenorhabditis briggsae]CAP38207.2 Protein CBG21386 [Caenorhabditis briggsae]
MDPRLTASSGYEYLVRNRSENPAESENEWKNLIMENQRLTQRVAFLEKIGKNQENFDGFTKEIDRLNALVVVRDAEIQELTKNSNPKVEMEGFEAKKKEWENKSAKMKGHIKSLEKKLEASNDFRFKITEEMEALLEEDVSPNQTMCLKMARQTSEYHKELWKKVRSNFEHLRNANRGLQMSLEELEVEKENMEFELGRRGTAIKEFKKKEKRAGQRIQELEKSIELKEQNEEKLRSENAEICKKFWDQTAQVDTLIKMLGDKTVRIIGDGMVVQEQQRYIQSLEQSNAEDIKRRVQDLAAKLNRNANICKQNFENRLDAQNQQVQKMEESAKLLMQEVFSLRFNYKESLEVVQKLKSKNSELEKMLSYVVEEEEKNHYAKMARWSAVGIRSLKRKREE